MRNPELGRAFYHFRGRLFATDGAPSHYHWLRDRRAELGLSREENGEYHLLGAGREWKLLVSFYERGAVRVVVKDDVVYLSGLPDSCARALADTRAEFGPRAKFYIEHLAVKDGLPLWTAAEFIGCGVDDLDPRLIHVFRLRDSGTGALNPSTFGDPVRVPARLSKVSPFHVPLESFTKRGILHANAFGRSLLGRAPPSYRHEFESLAREEIACGNGSLSLAAGPRGTELADFAFKTEIAISFRTARQYGDLDRERFAIGKPLHLEILESVGYAHRPEAFGAAPCDLYVSLTAGRGDEIHVRVAGRTMILDYREHLLVDYLAPISFELGTGQRILIGHYSRSENSARLAQIRAYLEQFR